MPETFHFLERPAAGSAIGDLSDLSSPRVAHLVGICGAGMKALAEYLSETGWVLSGSDQDHFSIQEAAPLRARGIRLTAGHLPSSLPPNLQLLIYSSAIPARNPERIRAAEMGVTQVSYNDILGNLISKREGIVVAGTHGKSTTTALCGHLLLQGNSSPSVIIGAETRSSNHWSGCYGSGKYFVAEGCEYQRHFLKLPTTTGVILGIEPDHFDYFTSFEDTVAAFGEFAASIPATGLLCLRGNSPAVIRASKSATCEIQTFSRNGETDWRATNVTRDRGWTNFDVQFRGVPFLKARFPLPGGHNVENALAAIAVAHSVGLSANAITEGLASFPGIRRRFEIVREEQGITWVDDYAHHPTAIRETLRTARQEYGSRRIRCLFQPHQTNRTLALMSEFAASFLEADEVIIAPVFGAREEAGSPQVSASQELTAKIQSLGQHACFADTLDLLRARVDDGLRSGDVVLTIGAGDINRIQHGSTR